MKRFTKALAFLLVLAMLPLFSLLTVARDPSWGSVIPSHPPMGTWGNLAWTLNESTGNLVISGEGEMLPVSHEDAWMAYQASIQSVVIESGITSIGENAFSDCTVLTSVTISNRVTSIGSMAFSRCSSLETIVFKGTEAEWDTITKGVDWDTETGDYVILFQPLAPDVSDPDTSEPDTSEPDTSEPDTSEPDTSEPDTSEPDTSEPNTSEPDASEPDASEPDTSEPNVSTPSESDPIESVPEVTDPKETNPLETTKAPETTNPTDTAKKGGCGSSVATPWSVIVLVATLPLVFFRKKKENE